MINALIVAVAVLVITIICQRVFYREKLRSVWSTDEYHCKELEETQEKANNYYAALRELAYTVQDEPEDHPQRRIIARVVWFPGLCKKQ